MDWKVDLSLETGVRVELFPERGVWVEIFVRIVPIPRPTVTPRTGSVG